MAMQKEHTLDHIFHALGDGTRRGMLEMLARHGECSAGDLGKPFDMSQPSASKHLRVLERAGLVRRRIDGREHRFRLEVKKLAEAEAWIARHREFWEGALDRLDGLLNDFDED